MCSELNPNNEIITQIQWWWYIVTSFLPKEEALKALNIVLHDDQQRRVTWYTDGSLLEVRQGVWKCELRVWRRGRRLWFHWGQILY
jgi:hypothetical protein